MKIFLKSDFQNGYFIQPYRVGFRNLFLACDRKVNHLSKHINTLEHSKCIRFAIGILLLIPIVNTIILFAARFFHKEQKEMSLKEAMDLVVNRHNINKPEQSKVQDLPKVKEKENRLIGIAKLRNGEYAQIKRVWKINEDSTNEESIFKIFKAYDNHGNCLGVIKFTWFRWMKNGMYGSELFPDGVATTGEEPLRYMGVQSKYGKDSSGWGTVNKVWVEWIAGKGNGVGSALIQAATEFGYKKGCEGRIQLDAAYDSQLFYYSIGMRSYNDERNKQYKKAYEKGKEKRIAFDGEVIDMPIIGRTKMAERISENPILFETDPKHVMKTIRRRSLPNVLKPQRAKRRISCTPLMV